MAWNQKEWIAFRRTVWIIFGSWWVAALLLWFADVPFFRSAAAGMFGSASLSNIDLSDGFRFTSHSYGGGDGVNAAFWVYLLPFIVFCFLKIAVPLIAGRPAEVFSLCIRQAGVENPPKPEKASDPSSADKAKQTSWW